MSTLSDSERDSLLAQLGMLSGQSQQPMGVNFSIPHAQYYSVESCIIKKRIYNPFIHELSLDTPSEKVVASIKGPTLDHEVEGSQEFLLSASKHSEEVRDAILEWVTKYFGLVLGMEDVLEFTQANVPKEYQLDTVLNRVQREVATSLASSLIHEVATTTLGCTVLGKSNVPEPTKEDMMSRLLQMAKDSKGKG